MTLEEAIIARHSVRHYIHKPFSEELIQTLQEKIDECNREGNLRIRLVTNETKAFTGIMSYGQFYGVENYLIMIGKKAEDLDERVGYYGEKLVLFVQTLGLNTCWVGISYRKVEQPFKLKQDEKVACVISIGYGENKYRNMKKKSCEAVSNIKKDSPSWFRKGMEAVVLCPTAVNQQRFNFELLDETRDGKQLVLAKTKFSLIGYTKMDLGIAKYHFELAAGKENFEWK